MSMNVNTPQCPSSPTALRRYTRNEYYYHPQQAKDKGGHKWLWTDRQAAGKICLEPESPLQLVHVNDIHGDASTAAYLLQFDSVHGRFVGYECKAVDSIDKSQSFEVKGNGVEEQVGFTSHPKPDQVPERSRS